MKEDKKLKLGWISILALIVSICALVVSILSLRNNLGYIRQYEDHDVVAKAIRIRFIEPGSFESADGEDYVDLAFINRGNQTEIIREASFCFADSSNRVTRTRGMWTEAINLQLAKGEKRVVRLSSRPIPKDASTPWIWVSVRAIGPDGEDVNVSWPVSGVIQPMVGGLINPIDKPLMKIISNGKP